MINRSTLSGIWLSGCWLLIAIPSSPSQAAWQSPADRADESTEKSGPKGKIQPARPNVPGLDLESAKVWRKIQDLPDLYEASPDQPGKFRRPRGVFQMPLEIASPASLWVKFPVTKGRFYIQHRSNRNQPQTERTYGPFQGDPFKLLELEQLMTDRLQSDRYSPDDVYRILLLLATNDGPMARRAVRLMQAALGSDQPARHRKLYESRIRTALTRYADVLADHELKREAAALEQQLERIDSEITALTVELEEADYLHVPESPLPLPELIPDGAWGDVTDGLRLAGVRSLDAAQVGAPIRFTLIVENVSDQPIKFSCSDLLQSATAEVLTPSKQKLPTSRSWFSGIAPLRRYWLEPGERIAICQPSLMLVEQTSRSAQAGTTQVVADLKQGKRVMIARYRIRLGGNSSWQRQPDGVLRRVSPARGEWTGSLASGYVGIVAAKPADH